MYVRRLRPEQAHSWRELRLRALKEAPHAFGSTYEEERRRAAGLWEERTAAFAAGLERVMFVAEVAGRLVGCAGAMTEDGEPYVISMWVEPAHRGRRLGEELLAAVAGWARGRGHGRLRLWVVRENRAAIALYERVGFRRTGRTQPLPHSSDVVEEEFVTDLTELSPPPRTATSG